MEWGTIRDYMFLILGTFFAVVQLINEWKKKRRIYFVLLLIAIGIFIWLGIDQINRNNKDKADSKNKFSTLQQSFDSLIKQGNIKQAKDSEFQNSLLEEYKIARDSATNKPKQVNYNTKIDKARDVYIGDKN